MPVKQPPLVRMVDFADLIFCHVPTPDAFAANGWDEYAENEPVFWGGYEWFCLDWISEPNEFILCRSEDDWTRLELENPYIRREILENLEKEMTR